MRIVLFSRVPRWYSFKNERLAGTLAADGFEIVGVFVEKIPTMASLREWIKKLGWKVFIEKIRDRITGNRNGTKFNGIEHLPKINIDPDVYFFDSHSSPECVAKLKELEPDVVVLRGCGIIREPVLQVPSIGVINPHYALLPDFRGMDVTEWSALCGAPIAVSVHTVNKGVDTGSVIGSKTIHPEADDTVGSLRDKSAAMAVKLLRDALIGFRDGNPFPDKSPDTKGRQYFQMHDRLKDLANARLKKLAKNNGNNTSG